MNDLADPNTCEHRKIETYSFTGGPDKGAVALWGCVQCRRKFAPLAAAAVRPAGLREAAKAVLAAWHLVKAIEYRGDEADLRAQGKTLAQPMVDLRAALAESGGTE